MTQEPLNLDREEAISRLTGAIIGPPGEGVVAGSEADDLDTRQTCLVLTLSDAARANLHGAARPRQGGRHRRVRNPRAHAAHGWATRRQRLDRPRPARPA